MERIEIIGHLGADLQLITPPNGKPFVTCRVACSSKVNEQDVTMWYDVTSNNVNAPINEFLTKGTQVFVRGLPSYRVYDSAKYHQKFVGVSIYALEIQLCSSKRDSEQQAAEQPAAEQSEQPVEEAEVY